MSNEVANPLEEMKYSDRMSAVEKIIDKIRTSEDVDDALLLFETGCNHLKNCKKKIEIAKGKYEEILSSSGFEH